jgi:hypothetical protein
MQAIDAPRLIEISTFNFAEFAQILPLQKQPADGKYGGYKDKAEQPFFVCAVLAGADCQFIAESHVDPHVRNQVPRGHRPTGDGSLQRVYRKHVFLSAKRLGAAGKSIRLCKVNSTDEENA